MDGSLADKVQKAAVTIKNGTIGLGGTVARKALHFWGLVPSYAINLWISQNEYKHEKSRIRRFYEPEIAAKLGKRPQDLTDDDLDEVAKNNPALEDALSRNKKKRTLSFTVSSIAITVAVVATAAILALTALTGGLMILAGGALGLSIFMIAEKILEPIGRKILGISEPSIDNVKLQPELQPELSLPSQVKYLASLQQNINPRDPRTLIQPEQVFSVFVTANPTLAEKVTAEFGAPYAELPNDKRLLAATQFGAEFNVEQITADLNNRLIRAQELAFIVNNQQSGVGKLDAPELTALEIANAKLQAAQKKVGELSAQIKEKAADVGEKVKFCAQNAYKKLGFNKSKVECAVPENQDALMAMTEPQETIAPKAFDPGALAAERLKMNSIKPDNILNSKTQQMSLATP